MPPSGRLGQSCDLFTLDFAPCTLYLGFSAASPLKSCRKQPLADELVRSNGCLVFALLLSSLQSILVHGAESNPTERSPIKDNFSVTHTPGRICIRRPDQRSPRLLQPHLSACGMFRFSAGSKVVLGSTLWHGGWGPNRCRPSEIDGHTNRVLPST